MSNRSAAHYFLEGLTELGIDYIFANLGTDHVSIIEEMARWDQEGRPHPQVILCPHETVAVHMAGGYALATGRGQAVLVHVDAGTANAAMAMQNLFRYRLPVLLMAGRAPYTLRGELPGSRDAYVHFVQDPFDIASIVRPYVKWEYSLPSGVVAKEALRRGHAFMQSDPPGPVYMMLPRETLAETIEGQAMPGFPEAKYGPVQVGGVEPARAEAFAEALMAAKHPIAITAYLGRKPEAVAVLDALARECGIRVVEHNGLDLNIPHDSPCFAGFDPVAAMEGADLGLLLDVDVPFLPKYAPRAAQMRWLQVDIDPLKADFPMWGFATDMRIQGDCTIVLRQVLEIVQARAGAAYRQEAAARLASFAPAREARRQRLAAAAAKLGESDAISPDYLCAVLAGKLGADDIVLNESIRNTLSVQEQIPRTRPRSYVGLGGAGLGYSGGMALGIKLARPDRRVVQIIGDGSFHFSAPDSVYAAAQHYQLPIFTIVLDNRGWQAVKSSTLRVYPKGAAAESDKFLASLESGRQGEERRFEEVARAFGAYGECVRDPEDVSAAIDRCLAALDDGRAAVLTVRVTPL
ncbi:acetolactate synthase-1/2/3 large subunit [Rhizobiales bacterium GAS191]|nr:acetolactate synthase-1/2/3 large subunit [Rhizobiales bacterium GAS113]SEB98026.1 acetolactate synthase-1/2/3 large subunit [Rhizobiales bacterium GAS188]SED25125.1 acetolactate synthase-1/2/3 large subunit [Rhizobiales bacterium GAS191]